MTEFGWIMFQNYQLKGYLDICIVDNGLGLLGSYQQSGMFQIIDHQMAIERALNGLSTKVLLRNNLNIQAYCIKIFRHSYGYASKFCFVKNKNNFACFIHFISQQSLSNMKGIVVLVLLHQENF